MDRGVTPRSDQGMSMFLSVLDFILISSRKSFHEIFHSMIIGDKVVTQPGRIFAVGISRAPILEIILTYAKNSVFSKYTRMLTYI